MKLSMYKGCFRILGEQNPKLSLGIKCEQVFMEKTKETSCCKIWEIAGTDA